MPPRKRKCSYREGNRRCPYDGNGDPVLCNAHRMALAQAAAPRNPLHVIADAMVNFLSGNPVNTDATIGAAETIFSQFGGMGTNYRPDVVAGASEDATHRREQAGWSNFRPTPPGAQPGRDRSAWQPDPEAEERRRAVTAARRVMGFASEPLTVPVIAARKRQLAKRWHPDRPGGSVQKMAAINDAADVLLASLNPQ